MGMRSILSSLGLGVGVGPSAGGAGSGGVAKGSVVSGGSAVQARHLFSRAEFLVLWRHGGPRRQARSESDFNRAWPDGAPAPKF